MGWWHSQYIWKKSHVPNHRPVANGDLPINWIIKMEHKTYSKMGPVSCLIPRNLRGPGGLPGNEASCRVNMNGDRALPVQVAFHHPDISRQHLTKNMCVGCLGCLGIMFVGAIWCIWSQFLESDWLHRPSTRPVAAMVQGFFLGVPGHPIQCNDPKDGKVLGPRSWVYNPTSRTRHSPGLWWLGQCIWNCGDWISWKSRID